MQTQKRKRYQKDSAPPDDVITLIQLVRQNPVLYNYKLQPNQRRRADVLQGWSQIAHQIGNKYTVEECRRKWKNLRDTYHQYRLRKPKLLDGSLAKWRYAKELDFLSNVYQPKLKSNRQTYDKVANLLLTKYDEHDHKSNSLIHHSSTPITLDAAETFILTTYDEEGVNDVVTTIDHHGSHDDPDMGTMELTENDEVVDRDIIVKNEHANSLDEDDEDGATGAEVDYEEVCMYEEDPNSASHVDCETIISSHSPLERQSSPDSKDYQTFIDANGFLTNRGHFNTTSGSVLGVGGKLKNISLVSANGGQTITTIPISFTTAPSTSNDSNLNSNSSANSNVIDSKNVLTTGTLLRISSPHPSSQQQQQVQQQQHQHQQVQSQQHQQQSQQHQQQQQQQQQNQQNQQQQQQLNATSSTSSSSTIVYPLNDDTREELDLFFDFLKTKIQRFSKSEITTIQVEFLNCISRRENARKNNDTMDLVE